MQANDIATKFGAPVSMHLAPIFPNPVISSLTSDDAALFERFSGLCLSARERDPGGRKVSNMGGWQSQDTVLDEPQLAELKAFICHHAGACFGEALNMSAGYNLTIQNSWINISGRYNYNLSHTHPQAIFSGVLYIQAEDGNGDIYFENSDQRDLENKVYPREIAERYCMYNTYFFKPRSGLMLIFPASLRHMVHANGLDKERISVAFNVWAERAAIDEH